VSDVEQPVTAGFGVATLLEDTLETDTLLRIADRALYRAKRARARSRRRARPACRDLMVDSTTPVPVCTRPAAQDGTRRKGPVTLPLCPFGVHRPASTGHAHPGTAAAESTI
jgi:hypothetical protein